MANIDQSLNSLHRAGSFEICNARQRGHKHWKALQGCAVRAHAEVGGGEAPLVRTPTPDTAHHHHNVVTEMVMAMVVMVELITGVTVLVKAPVIHCPKSQVLLLSFWLSKVLIELSNQL